MKKLPRAKIAEGFDTLERLKLEREACVRSILETYGFTRTCETPGSVWLWCVEVPEGRKLVVNEATALHMAGG